MASGLGFYGILGSPSCCLRSTPCIAVKAMWPGRDKLALPYKFHPLMCILGKRPKVEGSISILATRIPCRTLGKILADVRPQNFNQDKNRTCCHFAAMLLELQGLKRPVRFGVRLGSQEFAMQIRYNGVDE